VKEKIRLVARHANCTSTDFASAARCASGNGHGPLSPEAPEPLHRSPAISAPSQPVTDLIREVLPNCVAAQCRVSTTRTSSNAPSTTPYVTGLADVLLHTPDESCSTPSAGATYASRCSCFQRTKPTRFTAPLVERHGERDEEYDRATPT